MDNLNNTILIVDDDERMLRALAKTLRSEGAQVITTQGAGDAVGIISRLKTSVDLVITDLRMPHITGVALLGFIRMTAPDLPVIVLTAFGSPEMMAECLRQGAAAFLEKNLTSAQLLAEVQHVLAVRKRNQEPPVADTSWKNAATDEIVESKNCDE